MAENTGEVTKVRLFVGGLSSEVSAIDLKERFSPLGTVQSIELPAAKYCSGPHRGFAYVDFLPTSEAALKKLISSYSGCKWRGGFLRIETAKEHYVDKLQREWTAEAEAETLAAEEAQRLREKNDAPATPVQRQAKSWPLLLLEQPEKSDKWKTKRDFDQGVEVDGIKLFFPRLKKLKTVPSRGLGKHKRSFQRVESLPLHQLLTCDYDESLHTGSFESSIKETGSFHENMEMDVENDPVSLAVAKERQRQLDLLSKLFPSDSPREQDPSLELFFSPRNGAIFKKGFPRVDGDDKMVSDLDEVEVPDSGEETLSPSQRNEDGYGSGNHVDLPDGEEEPSTPASDVVKEGENTESISPLAKRDQDHSTGIQADEPEMWVSFMDTMPIPVKTEENVSEFDLDELSLLLSEDDDESVEEETEEVEAAEPLQETPKRKGKKKKKKKKKSKSIQIAQNLKGSEQENVNLLADWMVKDSEASVSPMSEEDERSLSVSEPTVNDMTGDEEEPLTVSMGHKGRAKTYERESRPLEERKSSGQPLVEPNLWISGMEELSPEEKQEGSSDDAADDLPAWVVEDEELSDDASLDASMDSESDQPDLWVSGMDALPPPPEGKDKSSRNKAGKLSVHAMEEDGTSAPTSEDEGHPDLWVSGLEPISPLPHNDENFHDGLEISYTLAREGENESAGPPSLNLQENEGELSRGLPEKKSHTTLQPKEREVELATVSPPSLECKVETGTVSPPSLIPQGNQLTRATWKNLVGETGRVVFSLKQITGTSLAHVPDSTGEPPSSGDCQAEEEFVEVDNAQNTTSGNSNCALDQDGKNQGSLTAFRKSSSFRLEAPELDAFPQLPVFTDSNTCPFMKSPIAEKEWRASKSALRTDYRAKYKQAVKQSKKLRGK